MGDESCDARIRPFPDTRELECDLPADGHSQHRANLRDYAFPGSNTVLSWLDDDRRNFHGVWPGVCGIDQCVLPAGHHGRHQD